MANATVNVHPPVAASASTLTGVAATRIPFGAGSGSGTSLSTHAGFTFNSSTFVFTVGNNTDGLLVYHSTNMGAEVGTSTLITAQGSSILAIRGSDSASVGDFLRLCYFNGTTNKSALEVNNTAAGATGVLDLMKAGGDVRIGSTSGARLQCCKGTDAASGSTLTLVEGNFFDVTGNTAIDYITTTRWQAGSVVTLQFDSNPVVNHNTGSVPGNTAAILLAGAANFSTGANDTLTLVYDGVTWREIARAVI